MLSDGAAGASDPTRRLGYETTVANPYSAGNPDHNPPTVHRYGERGNYGSFGVCPYGQPTRFAELTDTAGEPSTVFPFCLDEDPTTRHFCYPGTRAGLDRRTSVGGPTFDVGFGPRAEDRNYDYGADAAVNAANGRIYDFDVGDFPNGVSEDCLYYDVDDYARDWADFVGGIEDDTAGNSLLPTIFTIGFGLSFEEGNNDCEDNIADCLGEELLRYIADVGDNFRIDNDYQQDYTDNGLLDDSITTDGDSQTSYGQPGLCEPDDGSGYIVGSPPEINLLEAGLSCGNYFNAPTPEELEIVFDEIASRMFTRISQ